MRTTSSSQSKKQFNASDTAAIMNEFDLFLQSTLHTYLSGKLLNMALYHMGWKDIHFEDLSEDNRGKRGRPMLALLTYLVFKEDFQRIFPIAAAIELLHNSSLIYDDIQDRDSIRRGRPAVWTVWGTDEAINLGCAMQAMVLPVLSKMSLYVSSAKTQAMQSYLSHVMLDLAMGQQRDIEWTKRHALPDEHEYLAMIGAKTASLFKATTYLAASAAEVDRISQQSLQSFGEAIGMSFQIFDDIIGVWGSRERGLDKPSLDLQNRKKTYPLILSFSLAGDEDAQLLERYYQMEIVDETMLHAVTDLLNRLDTRNGALKLGLSYMHTAISTLSRQKGNESARQLLMDWVQYVVNKQVGTLIDVNPVILRATSTREVRDAAMQ